MGYYSGFYSKNFWVEGVESFEAGSVGPCRVAGSGFRVSEGSPAKPWRVDSPRQQWKVWPPG